MANNIQKSINDAISTIVSRRIDALALDKTVIGIIDSYVDPGQGIYKIKCDGGYFNARSQSEDAIYQKGMSVYVQIPQNDMTKEKLIISRANTFRNEIQADVTVSAINNFSIIGTNLLKNTNIIENSGLGIRSYHNPEEENENTISHRVRSLYGEGYYYELLDEDIFNLYKKDATALMVEADFRTALSEQQRQQTSGVYGIGLDLKFENTNFSIGETQGEIFDYYADLVQGVITIIDNSGQYVSAGSQKVINYSSQLEEDLNTDSITITALQSEGGFLDQYKNYISSIVDVFETSGEIKDIDNSWLETMNSYLILLDDLKNQTFENKEELKKNYYEWKEEEIASPRYNNVAFVLDSNNMTGNPYNYSDWSTQYAIFSVDMKTLAGINDILFYKDGFEVDEEKCTHDNTGRQIPREDLFIKNIKVYALKPISAENGDYRLEISSPNGLIFNSLSEEENLQAVAKVTKAYYQNLTEQCGFYWFKKSRSVTNVSSKDFHRFGGTGWAYLPDKGNGKKITLTAAENKAYDNLYKCVAVIGESTVLLQEFHVYNFAVNIKLKISSDLGVKFSFDSGNPLLTCLINDKESEEIENENYHYYWAMVVNGQRIFLNEKMKTIVDNTTSITDIVGMLSFNSLIKGIKFYDHEEEITENFELATRILYPISNIGLENNVTFECYVEQKFNNEYAEIGYATLTLSNSTNAAINGYRIVIENGDQVFQYDEYGNSPIAEKLKDPIQIKPLICHFFNPTGLEIPNGNYTLNWIVPINNSMLIPQNPERLIENPATKLKEIDNTSTQFVFNIAEFYNEENQNNQVTCQVIFNGEAVNKDTNLLFTKVGENGTNGTDVVARIIPRNVRWIYDGGAWSVAEGNTILDKEPLTLYRSIDSSNKVKLTLNNGRHSITDQTQINLVPSGVSAHLYLKNEEIPSNNIDTIWNISGSTQTTRNNNGKYLDVDNMVDISGFTSSTVIWDDTLIENRALENYILKAKMRYEEKEYYAFYPLCVIRYPGALPNINRLSIDKGMLLKEITYNADGRNPVYNHSQGVKINNLPSRAYIKWKALGGTLEGQIDIVPDFKLIAEKNQKRNSAATEITTAADVDTIYILPNDDYNGANCNNRVVAEVWKNNSLVATVIVPIYMHLNTFGLASLNAWDGNTVTIDENNGYVMAPQVGAGEKDGNNRFTGILMGKTETSTGHGEKEKQVGLFGYAHGLQSIFLDAETGNATFGLPDGYKLNSNLEPESLEDNYSEGRIELRPGDVSSIGGWKIGRRSLFYATNASTETKIINGKSYPPGSVLPDLEKGNEKTHEKDIGPKDSGILLSANNIYKENNQNKIGNNPYVSLKSRPLIVKNSQDHEGPYDIDNTTGNSPLVNGDSLELQLDPNQSSIFTIYRHYIKGNKWTRSPLVGINAEGRFYSNALQDEETALNLNYIAAFGEGVIQQKYTGIYIGTSGRTFFKAFVDADEETKISSLRISGSKDGTQDGNSYERPIALYGRDILLYANDNDIGHKLSEQTNSKLIINHSGFIAGNFETNPIPKINEKGEEEEDFDNAIDVASIKLINSTASGKNSQIMVPNNFYLKTRTNNSALGNIYLQTINRGTTDAIRSYLTLEQNGEAKIQGWTNSNVYAQNGNINLYARTNGTTDSYLILAKSGGNSNNTTLHAYKNIILDAADDGTININNKAENKLLIDSTVTVLRREATRTFGGYTNLRSQLYLSDNTGDENSTSYLDAINKLGIRSIGNSWIVTKGNSFQTVVGEDGKSKTTLTLTTGANWNGGSAPADNTNSFSIINTHLGGIQFRSGVKPGYANTQKNNLITNGTYTFDSAALTGNAAGTNNTNGGLYFNWGYFPGRMFANSTHTGNINYVDTSIYATHKIVSNSDVWYASGSSSSHISLKNHTHPFSKGVTVKVYSDSSTYISLTNAGAGSNASLAIGVVPWSQASASYTGGNFEGGTIYGRVRANNDEGWDDITLWVDSDGNVTASNSGFYFRSSTGFGVSSINAYVSSHNYGVTLPDNKTVSVTGTSGTPNFQTA